MHLSLLISCLAEKGCVKEHLRMPHPESNQPILWQLLTRVDYLSSPEDCHCFTDRVLLKRLGLCEGVL